MFWQVASLVAALGVAAQVDLGAVAADSPACAVSIRCLPETRNDTNHLPLDAMYGDRVGSCTMPIDRRSELSLHQHDAVEQPLDLCSRTLQSHRTDE
jgi:hypothetical protein